MGDRHLIYNCSAIRPDVLRPTAMITYALQLNDTCASDAKERTESMSANREHRRARRRVLRKRGIVEKEGGVYTLFTRRIT